MHISSGNKYTFSAGLWQAFCASTGKWTLPQVSDLGNCWLAECELFHSQYIWFDKHQIKFRQGLGDLCLNQEKQLGKPAHPFWSTCPGSQPCFQAPCLGTRIMGMHSPLHAPPRAPEFPAMRSGSPQAGSWVTRAYSLPRADKHHCSCGLQLWERKPGVLPLARHSLRLFGWCPKPDRVAKPVSQGFRASWRGFWLWDWTC